MVIQLCSTIRERFVINESSFVQFESLQVKADSPAQHNQDIDIRCNGVNYVLARARVNNRHGADRIVGDFSEHVCTDADRMEGAEIL